MYTRARGMPHARYVAAAGAARAPAYFSFNRFDSAFAASAFANTCSHHTHIIPPHHPVIRIYDSAHRALDERPRARAACVRARGGAAQTRHEHHRSEPHNARYGHGSSRRRTHLRPQRARPLHDLIDPAAQARLAAAVRRLREVPRAHHSVTPNVSNARAPNVQNQVLLELYVTGAIIKSIKI
jgi:hypothetical protein